MSEKEALVREMEGIESGKCEREWSRRGRTQRYGNVEEKMVEGKEEIGK